MQDWETYDIKKRARFRQQPGLKTLFRDSEVVTDFQVVAISANAITSPYSFGIDNEMVILVILKWKNIANKFTFRAERSTTTSPAG